jgi:hypothetical protein
MDMNMLRRAAILAAIGGAVGWARGSANWSGVSHALSIPAHISGSGQSCSGSVVLTLAHDTPCTIEVSASGVGQEVLTTPGDALATSYKLTGPALEKGDATWVQSDVFITRQYSVKGASSPDSVTLWVQGTAPKDRAPAAGAYSAGIVLTVSW